VQHVPRHHRRPGDVRRAYQSPTTTRMTCSTSRSA
jgi:hypothetical protein